MSYQAEPHPRGPTATELHERTQRRTAGDIIAGIIERAGFDGGVSARETWEPAEASPSPDKLLADFQRARGELEGDTGELAWTDPPWRLPG